MTAVNLCVPLDRFAEFEAFPTFAAGESLVAKYT